jgi:hypothetical protein
VKLRQLGVNRRTIWRLISQGRLKATTNPIDHRARLLRRAEVEQLALHAPPPPSSSEGAAPTADDQSPQQELDESNSTPPRHRPYPRTIGIVSDPTFRSRDAEAFMREHWKPDQC